MASYTIWHNDNIDLAKWLIKNTELKTEKVDIKTIPRPNSSEFTRLPDEIMGILYLDTPDIIASINLDGPEIPFFTSEISDHTPQGQHPKQRFSRLAASVEKSVPATFVLPKKKSKYSRSRDIFYALVRMMDIHSVPCFIYDWEDKNGILLRDPKHPSSPPATSNEMKNLFKFFNLCKSFADSERPLTHLISKAEVQDRIDLMRKEAYSVKPNISQYGTLTLVKTKDLPDYVKKNCKVNGKPYVLDLKKLPLYFQSRDESLIFSPEGNDPFRFEHGGDPYTGMIGFFDYCFSRTGKTTRERRMNLILNPKKNSNDSFDDFADKYQKTWEKDCSLQYKEVKDVLKLSLFLREGCKYTKRKELRIFSHFTDMIIFDNALIYW